MELNAYPNRDIGDRINSYSNEGPSAQSSFLRSGVSNDRQKEDTNIDLSSLRRLSSSVYAGRPKRRMLILDWKWEILASFVSYVAMVALVAILYKYATTNGTVWILNDMSLNTVVSIFSTLIRATSMSPVGVSLLQAGVTYAQGGVNGRWSGQRFRDLDTFHNAAMGALGSMKMLVLIKP